MKPPTGSQLYGLPAMADALGENRATLWWKIQAELIPASLMPRYWVRKQGPTQRIEAFFTADQLAEARRRTGTSPHDGTGD